MAQVTYSFEPAKGTIDVNDVKNIITKAGDNQGQPDNYNPGNYTYVSDGSKKVNAKGQDTMNDTVLETAGKQVLGKTVTVKSY